MDALRLLFLAGLAAVLVGAARIILPRWLGRPDRETDE